MSNLKPIFLTLLFSFQINADTDSNQFISQFFTLSSRNEYVTIIRHQSRYPSSWDRNKSRFFFNSKEANSFEFNLERELKDYECRSGEWLGLKTMIKNIHETEEGGGVSLFMSHLVSSVPYQKIIEENGERVSKEVNDNIFYTLLIYEFPELVNPRQDGFYIKELQPKIPNVTYLKDDYGRPITPQRTWWYDTFGRNGNQVLKIEDNPLKVTRNSQGKIIKMEAQDSPKFMKTYQFFPRHQVADVKLLQRDPSIQDSIVMTLSTGEEVRFDSQTGALVGGVFKSEPRAKNEYSKGPYLYNPTKVTYTGSGVWIEIDELAKKNNFFRDELDGTGVKNLVNVYKNNPFRKCSIPSGELWEMKSGHRNSGVEYQAFAMAQGEKNPSPWGHLNTGYKCYFLKYKSDEEMDQFFKTKCGFGFLD